MTLNGAIMELVLIHEHSSMPENLKKRLQEVIEVISEYEVSEDNTWRWIPCNEQLPENDDSVLISHHSGVTKAWWTGRAWCNAMRKNFKSVTAWMPLPEPYKPKEIT